MSIKGELTTTGLTTTGDTTVEGCINGIWIKGKRDYRSSIFISTREELDNPSISSKPLPDDTIAIGYEALKSASEHGAIGNIAIGREAGRKLTKGYSNICIGEQAGYNMKESKYNICIGFAAGQSITTGTHNIAIGSTNSASSTGEYNIAIGASVSNGKWSKQVSVGGIRYAIITNTTTESDICKWLDNNTSISTNSFQSVVGSFYRYYINYIKKTSTGYDIVHNGGTKTITRGSSSTLGATIYILSLK